MPPFPSPPAGVGSPRRAEPKTSASLEERPARAVRLLLVHEQEMFADALSRALATEHDLQPVGVAPSLVAAIGASERTSPDVVLVDLRVGDLGGGKGLEALRRVASVASVIVLSDPDDPGSLSSAIRAGARGYVLKSRGVDELVAIIRQAVSGSMVLTVDDVPRVIDRLEQTRRSESEARRSLARLTVREGEILEHLTNGRSTSETATALNISPLTVRSHVKSILAKLGVHSKVEAVSYALRNGLVEDDRSA